MCIYFIQWNIPARIRTLAMDEFKRHKHLLNCWIMTRIAEHYNEEGKPLPMAKLPKICHEVGGEGFLVLEPASDDPMECPAMRNFRHMGQMLQMHQGELRSWTWWETWRLVRGLELDSPESEPQFSPYNAPSGQLVALFPGPRVLRSEVPGMLVTATHAEIPSGFEAFAPFLRPDFDAPISTIVVPARGDTDSDALGHSFVRETWGLTLASLFWYYAEHVTASTLYEAWLQADLICTKRPSRGTSGGSRKKLAACGAGPETSSEGKAACGAASSRKGEGKDKDKGPGKGKDKGPGKGKDKGPGKGKAKGPGKGKDKGPGKEGPGKGKDKGPGKHKGPGKRKGKRGEETAKKAEEETEPEEDKLDPWGFLADDRKKRKWQRSDESSDSSTAGLPPWGLPPPPPPARRDDAAVESSEAAASGAASESAAASGAAACGAAARGAR